MVGVVIFFGPSLFGEGGLIGAEYLYIIFPNTQLGLFLLGLPYVIVLVGTYSLVLKWRKATELKAIIFFGLGAYVAYLGVAYVFLEAISNWSFF